MQIDWFPNLLSWIGSSAFIGLLVFIGNVLISQTKEKNRLRVCCRILLVEVSRHKLWLKLLLDKNPDVPKLLLSSDIVDSDWTKLKYDPAFTLIPFDKFELIIDHYREICALQKVVEGSLEKGINHIDPGLINKKLAGCYKAYKILYEFAKPNTYPKPDYGK